MASVSVGYNRPDNRDSGTLLAEIGKKIRILDENLCCKLNKISDSLQSLVDLEINEPTKSYDFELTCSSIDGRLLIQRFDKNTGTLTLFESDGITAVTDGSNSSNCTPKQYDFEPTEVCVNGEKWTKIFVFDTNLNIPVIISILWLDSNNNIVFPPDPLLVNNEKCNPTCLPLISDCFGNDLSTLQPSHNFSIQKPNCCKIKITTTIGSFMLSKEINQYTTSDFGCLINITSVDILSGNCNLSDIYIIGNKLK
jgi:hypothetical protein